ncbi:serine-tRNA(Ala) deacylase AlaX [Neobacillus dielmonensis]|uniref:serine-tRNA(Ala) deacylase AlaX n=1 Tax=Neobacillus dielmonensis TaxID=1347369 RepID=UPI0005A6CD49|nr:serine-tRNA(Ala) deacylase AlaX [Neobacillus dielmonensis]
MATKLYYHDAYISLFTAHVLRQEQDKDGRWLAVLDQTAFYPTGGGQPFDTGFIGEQQVVNVEEVDGEIFHYLDSPIQDLSNEVCCTINWERRFDHMQQHAGQHIFSAAFDHLFGYKTIGFHLGNDAVTIDLETEQLNEEQAEAAEQLANRIILENRTIETKWVTEGELSLYPLRKETKVKDNIRLVIIPEFDYNGCGGTHPKTTGEVRAIKVLNWERQKKKVRLTFICGERVLSQFDQKQKLLLKLTQLLNAPERDMEQAVVKMVESAKAAEKQIEEQLGLLLHYEAREWLDKCTDHQIGIVFQNRTIQELQKLARLMITENNQAIVFLISENENRLQLVCARGEARAESMKKILSNALKVINGKGGGNDSFAQGGGDALVSGEQLLDYVQQIASKDDICNE